MADSDNTRLTKLPTGIFQQGIEFLQSRLQRVLNSCVVLGTRVLPSVPELRDQPVLPDPLDSLSRARRKSADPSAVSQPLRSSSGAAPGSWAISAVIAPTKASRCLKTTV